MAAKKKTSVLECEIETVRKVDSYVLDQFIQDVTGHAYESVCNQEWGNDSQHRFTVSEKIDSYDQGKWDRFKKTGHQESFTLSAVLNGLCSENKIPAGLYLITVCW